MASMAAPLGGDAAASRGGGNATSQTPQQQLQQQLMKQMEAPDSVMEPGVLSLLGRFIRANGNAVLAVQLISGSYRGTADMCNLVADWMEIADGPRGRDQAERIKGECLRELIQQRFDRNMADAIFGASAGATPEWLQRMVDHPENRQLIYDLADHHEQCLLLHYAIKRISEAGHQAELAGVAAASKYVAVYSRTLVSSIVQLHAEDEVTLCERLPKLVRVCCQEPYTYMYAQALLAALLASGSDYAWMRRIQQELSANANEHGRIAQHIDSLLTGLHKYPRLSDALYSLLKEGRPTTGDILILYSEYFESPSLPPVQLLHHSELFEMLLGEIFLPSRRKTSTPQPKIFNILAYAASVFDLPDGTHDKSLYPLTLSALQGADGLLCHTLFGSRLSARAVQLCESIRSCPLVAAGWLLWLRESLSETDTLIVNAEVRTGGGGGSGGVGGRVGGGSDAVPIHYLLLEEIAIAHERLRQSVFAVMTEELEKTRDHLELLALNDLRMVLIDRLLLLVRLGFVVPVLRYICNRTHSLDHSLVTYFVGQLMAMMATPLVEEWTRWVLTILSAEGIVRAFVAKADGVAPLKQFCIKVKEQFPMHEEFAALVGGIEEEAARQDDQMTA